MPEENNFLRPFIRWAGGKQNLVKYLLENTPANDQINKYWEPFLGAGSLFFANGFTNAGISDVNASLTNAYQQIKVNPTSVYHSLLDHRRIFDVEYYYDLRNEYNKQRHQKTIEQAARFIFLVHTSFNGIYRVNSKGEYNVPIGKMNPSLPSLDHLRKASKKLQQIEILNCSYKDILPFVQENDFIYLDPPYPKLIEKDQFQQFTVDKFSEQDQRELAGFANELNKRGCYVMLSNSKVPLIENLYSNWNLIEVPVVRYVSCKKERKKITELIIKNY